MRGIPLNGLFLPSNSPFPFLPLPTAPDLTNLVFVIPHSAHLHFIMARPFHGCTTLSEPGTHSVCFRCFTQ